MPYLGNSSRLGYALGDAWSDYIASGSAAPNAIITSPNGDIVHFDANGLPDYTEPHAGAGSDADVEKDPNSQFFGWTELQKAQYWAGKGATGLLTDAVRATATPVAGGAATYDADALAQNDAALRAGAQTDPAVAAALAASAAGQTYITPHAQQNLAPVVRNPKTLAEWWAMNDGGPRYTIINGVTVDLALLDFQAYLNGFGSAGLDPALLVDFQTVLAAANAAAASGTGASSSAAAGDSGTSVTTMPSDVAARSANVDLAPASMDETPDISIGLSTKTMVIGGALVLGGLYIAEHRKHGSRRPSRR